MIEDNLMENIKQLDDSAKIVLKSGLLIVLGRVKEFENNIVELIKKLN